MTGDRAAVVRYRLERARETLAEAELMAQSGHWNGCVNRLYYACFYAVNALLLHHGLVSAKHSGVRGFFNRDFVKTGKVAGDLGQLYNNLSRNRLRGDYDDLEWFGEAKVRPWLAESRRFVSEIETLLAASEKEAD